MPNFVALTGPGAAATLTADSVVLLPVGAIAAHGPRLPVATDFVIADAVATAVVAHADADTDGPDVWRLPTLAFSYSGQRAAPGTVSLAWDTFVRVLLDVAASVAATPARRLVLLDGHGSGSGLLQVARAEISNRHGLATFLVGAGSRDTAGDTAGDVAGDRAGDAGDAADVPGDWSAETSVMLHLHPESVRTDSARPDTPPELDDGAAAPEGEQRFAAAVARGRRAVAAAAGAELPGEALKPARSMMALLDRWNRD